MTIKGLAVSAAEMVGTQMVESGANRAIQLLPKQKQSKIRGILMVVVAIILFRAGIKIIKQG